MNSHHLSQRIAEEVRAVMARKRVTALALSQSTGLPNATLSRRLRGSTWTVDEVHAVAAALGVDAADLFRSACAEAVA